MLIATFLATTIVVATATTIVLLGNGNVRKGRVRAIRRIRTVRRRSLSRLTARMELTARLAWTRPVRRSVAREVRRVADRLERAAAGADRFASAQRDLSKGLEKLGKAGPVSWEESRTPGSRKARELTAGNGWLVALALGIGGLALAAANGWLLLRHVLPAVPEQGIVPDGVVDSVAVAASAAVLPFLLGLAYFALTAAGRALGLRVLAVVVVLLVVVLAGLEAAGTVVALETLGIAQPTWWGGVAVATLLGGTAALLPPTIAALAHAAIERFDRWLAARDRRAAGRAVARQDRMASGLRRTLDELASSVDGVRAEVLALTGDPAGRLFLHPSGQPAVERSGAVLRRLAVTVERDHDGPWAERPSAAAVASRVLGDIGALAVWGLAAAGALRITAAGLQNGAQQGLPGILTAGAFAAISALLVGGRILRAIHSAPGRRAGPAVRGATVLLLGLATASFAYALGSLAADLQDGLFPGPLAAAAWLNLLVLVAALASIRLGEGISALGGIVTFILASAAWLALRLLDAALAAMDLVLRGFRRRTRRAPRPPRSNRTAPVSAFGGARDRH